MEALTRIQANLALLEKHRARNRAAGKGTVEAEVVGSVFRQVTVSVVYH